ncbi:MAG TPA: nucleotidyltransferase family protein [Chitinophagaceae bacterium]|nr:nucleotidyltransferase family protein [Chitinophagaceae bacterium]
MQSRCGIIILAAGDSSRLGKPKQLLAYKGSTLLEYQVKQAQQSQAYPVIVVIGAHGEKIKARLSDYKEWIIENKEWQEGMASSIRCGINYLQEKYPGCEGAILMVSDQPYVTTELINKLITTHQETGKKIVSSSFGGMKGPPAFFHLQLFPELLQLKGDAGAKKVVEKYVSQVATVSFPGGPIDIDTAADYDALPEK